MKRIIICAVLLLGALAVSVYAHVRVESLSDALGLRIDALASVLREDNNAEIIEQSVALEDFWKAEEKTLVYFVRHSHIDTISMSVTRIPALARYGDYSEIYAELMSIRRQMEHIRSAEILSPGNLL